MTKYLWSRIFWVSINGCKLLTIFAKKIHRRCMIGPKPLNNNKFSIKNWAIENFKLENWYFPRFDFKAIKSPRFCGLRTDPRKISCSKLLYIAIGTTKSSPKNLKILTDHENIGFPLKFVSKIKIFSGHLWTDLKEEKRAC